MDTSNINPNILGGFPTSNPTTIPGFATTPNNNPLAPPPASMDSALDSARKMGHINEQQLLQNAFTGMIDTVEKSKIRPLQRESFVCSVSCCDDPDSTQQSFQRCIQKCNTNVKRASQAFQHELKRFQNRMQRQTQECQESARDWQMGGAKEADVQQQFKDCTDRVLGRNRQAIPELKQRLDSMLTPQAQVQ